MLDAAPRRADEKAGGAAHEQRCAKPVRVSPLLLEGEDRRSVEPDVQRRDQQTDGAERKVDVEAPPPRRLLRETAADDWADDAADRPRGQHEGEVLGALSQGHDVAEDDLGQGDDASAADALNAAAREQDAEVVGDGTEGSAKGEQHKRGDQLPLPAEGLGDGCDDRLADG